MAAITTPNSPFRPPITITVHTPTSISSSASSPSLPLFFRSAKTNPLLSSSVQFALSPFSTSSPRSQQQVENEEELDLNAQTQAALVLSLPSLPSPVLTVKEKKELASYAHSLGDKLKSQQVGKSGVTPSVAASFVENLESNELLKIKIHGTCPGELVDVVKHLEESTGSVAVSQIGRSVILYRPSLSKMKKREAQSARRSWRAKPSYSAGMQKRQVSRPSANGRGRANRD